MNNPLGGRSSRNGFLRGASLSRISILGHRGARSLAPENTLAAGRACRDIGADGWEFDVRLTNDHEPILLHDETLRRTTDVEHVFPNRSHLSVDHFTLEEIRLLDAGSWFEANDPFRTVTSGVVSPAKIQLFSQERVPTLEEALTLSKKLELTVNIELKTPFHASSTNDILLERTTHFIQELGMEREVLISSFNDRLIQQLKKRTPQIAGALLVDFIPCDPVGHLNEVGADALNLWKGSFDGHSAEILFYAGFGIFVWTVNDYRELDYFAKNKFIKGIITDWPQRLLAIQKRLA